MLVLVLGMLCPVCLLSPLLTQLPLHRPAPGPCQRKAATYHRTPTTATFSTITNLMRIYLQLYFLLKIFIYSCLILLKRNMETVNRIFDTCDNRNWWKCQCRGVWVSECRSVWVSECPCWVTQRWQHSWGLLLAVGDIVCCLLWCDGASYLHLRCPSTCTCSTQISITSTGVLFGTFKKALQSLIIHP